MTPVRVRAGTSGYQYRYWRGSFYPDKCKEADMLGEYGRRLPTVEINNSFYRMPTPAVMEKWAAQVPEDFRFAVKAPRRITHIKRLKEVGEEVEALLATVSVLGEKLGVVLFQLPPNFKCDLARLDGLLAALPLGGRFALEFRHESWFSDEVFARLRGGNVALCLCDEGQGDKAVPWVATASFGYLRLRHDTYTAAELAAVAKRVAAERWSDAYAYFKHEPDAPRLAAKLQGMLGSVASAEHSADAGRGAVQPRVTRTSGGRAPTSVGSRATKARKAAPKRTTSRPM
jgi:uncharacterized protein YecE (DUF72 family)